MNNSQTTPNPDLQPLNRLVGRWQLSGETEGMVTYEWMEGGFFLLQHFDFTLHGHRVKGMEVIGHLQPFSSNPSPEIWSRAYDCEGNTLDYVYELDDDTLMIWGGQKGSLSYFRGQFNADGTVNTGEWVWPGGGYKSEMRKIK
ncbi:hypothetical protein GXP67_31170 [Rhodocytophaga rosea]|uniref:DUF1579 domain-containing protein n=1 Tax=Rhodocytophaga rosea TaxID=2704465 RepID=A0A6C0GSN2_9BACT|nr:hypothetical protein [Rhodocytophaga rosea]QHT70794.1 hypothetical protein GXP67_31170 [Rhodocytophaga rosea]